MIVKSIDKVDKINLIFPRKMGFPKLKQINNNSSTCGNEILRSINHSSSYYL
jgi:hypothetical protein